MKYYLYKISFYDLKYKVCIGFFLLYINIFAQQYSFSVYSLDEGLSQSQVSLLFEDSRGYLWIATRGGGLNMFDGIKFTAYTIENGLESNTITAICEDKKGKIWFGVHDGYLMKFNGKKFFKYETKQGIFDNKITSLVTDYNGTLWAGTYNGNVYFLENNKFKKIKLPQNIKYTSINCIYPDKKGNLWIGSSNGIYLYKDNSVNYISTAEGLCNNYIQSITQDRIGNIWIATKNGVSMYNDVRFLNFFTTDGLLGNDVNSIMCDRNGSIWFAVYGKGISRFDGRNFTNFTDKNGLPNNNITTIIQDRTRNIWFGTDGNGICKFIGERFKYFTEMDGLPSNIIYSIIEDYDKTIWFGSKGGGACNYDGTKFTYLNITNGLHSNLIYCIYRDRQNNLWFGSQDNGVCKYDRKKFTTFNSSNKLGHDFVKTIIQDKYDNYWFGTWGGGIILFNGNTFTQITENEGLCSNYIYTIFEDNDGNIWISTEGKGIDMIPFSTPSNQIIEKKKLTKDDHINITTKIGLPHNQVLPIHQDKQGNIWIGTLGGGLCKFDGKIFESYTIKNGLNSNTIYLLLYDSKNKLWAGTEKGINRIDFFRDNTTPFIRTFEKTDGFMGIETNLNAVLEHSSGNIWFGTIKGVIQYNAIYDIPHILKPKIHLSNIKLFREDTDWKTYSDSLTNWAQLPTKLVLPYDKNNLTFEFCGIDMSAPDKLSYTWMLEGFDKNWTPLSKDQHATYPNIKYGKYIFKVKAISAQNVESQIVSFSFIIKRPYYATWWFYGLCALCSGAMIFGYVRVRINNLHKERELLEEKVKLRTILLEEEKAIVLEQKEEIQKQAQKLQEANAELEKLSIVARETVNSVLIMNAEGEIEWVNDSFIRMYGCTLPEFKRKFGRTIFEASNNEDIIFTVRKCIKTKAPVTYISYFETPNNEIKWIQTVLTPIIKDKQLIKLIAVDSDITKLKEQEELIKKEKEKSDLLLLNILPADVAKELKEKGLATPKYYNEVSVLFTDFKGFTKTCEGITPEEIVNELHSFFVKFDEIVEKYAIEKIKTIGDAYMCAAGLPIVTNINAFNAVLCGLEIQHYMMQTQKAKNKQNLPSWQLRLGIHTGPVIAGVVGKKKFAFDIWGDTVNIAARMESASEVNKVNISETTYEIIKNYFVCEYRGKIDAKNKGKINMYFVNSIKPEFSINSEGIFPNEEFKNFLNNQQNLIKI